MCTAFAVIGETARVDRRQPQLYAAIPVLIFVLAPAAATGPLNADGPDFEESFDVDPGWDAHRNELTAARPRRVTQDFGFRSSNHAGSAAGEIGGIVDRSPLETSSYAQVIAPLDLNQPLSYSGWMSLLEASHTVGFTSSSNIFIGFFNSREQGWRPPNFLGFQVRGHNEPIPNVASLELSYGTSAWAAGGIDWGRTIHPDGVPHHFDLSYDPDIGNGRITLDWDGDEIVALDVRPEHRAHGATFDRFGIFSMQLPGVPDGNTMEAYFDDLTINGAFHDFAADPGWLGVNNRKNFDDPVLYGINNFGYRPTNVAGGAPGELGGLVWRVEDSDEQYQAYYARDIGTLGLDERLFASGRIAFEKFSTDAGVMLGWFNSTEQDWPPGDFVGVYMDSLSDTGRFFAPMYGTGAGSTGFATAPWLLLTPDGTSMDWTIEYDPGAAGGLGAVTVTLNGQSRTLLLNAGDRIDGAVMDRFGLFNMQDNNGKHSIVYLDDLTHYVGDAPAATLDPFETGRFTLAATNLERNSIPIVNETELSSTFFPGGRRLTELRLESGQEIRAALIPDADHVTDDAMTIIFEPDSSGSATVSYDGDTLADLAACGRAALEVTLVAAPASGTLFSYVETAQTWDFGEVAINGPGVYQFAFADLNEFANDLDFTQIGIIGFGVRGQASHAPLRYEISDVRVVALDQGQATSLPEPGTMGTLMLLAWHVCGLRRRDTVW